MRPYLLLALVGCGRIGFDTIGSSGSSDATAEVDGRAMPDASFTTRHWINRNDGTPSFLYSPRLAYHDIRGTVVMYGGYTPGSPSSELWELAATGWTRLCTGCGPGPRVLHAFAYDTDRNRLVVFGGSSDGANYLSDLWEWDGTTWAEVTPTGPAPTGRQGSQMVYDSTRQRMVLIGGCTSLNSGNGDIYEYDGVAWTHPTPGAGPALVGGAGTGITYDPVARRTLVLGDDCRDSGSYRDDLWAWDGTWTQICGNCSGNPRSHESMFYDDALGVTWMTGGYDGGEIAGTWKLIGNQWQMADSLPPGRDSVGVAYDRARHTIVLYGGNGNSCGGDCDETWELVPN